MSSELSTSVYGMNVFANPEAFEHAQRVAKAFASSVLMVPDHFKGKVADCLLAYQIAARLNEDPLTIMRNMFVVQGRPGWTTAYMIARANKAGVFKSRITWDVIHDADNLAVTAKAILADTGEEVRITCDMRMAKAEGWTKNSKYTSMPELMLRWRSAAMLIRLYVPEVMLGVPTIEEIETMESPPIRDVTPAKTAAQALDDFAGSIEHVIGNGTGEINESEADLPTADDVKGILRQPEATAAAGGADIADKIK